MCARLRSPLQLGAPQDVLLAIHQDGEVLVLPLLDGVGARGDGAHLPKLQEDTHTHTLSVTGNCHGGVAKSSWCVSNLGNSAVFQTVLQLQFVHP